MKDLASIASKMRALADEIESASSEDEQEEASKEGSPQGDYSMDESKIKMAAAAVRKGLK